MNKKQQDEKDMVFKRLFGVKPEAFAEMKAMLQKEYDQLHKSGGVPPRLTIEDRLFITLKYLREYRTMESANYGISKGQVCETIR